MAANMASTVAFIAATAAAAAASHGLLAAALLPAANAVAIAGIAATFALSGIPQVVESLVAASQLNIDTHVLMTLAVAGTAFLGMAHEGALLLLLFR